MVLTEGGPLRIEVPRDRQVSFEPLLIPKGRSAKVLPVIANAVKKSKNRFK